MSRGKVLGLSGAIVGLAAAFLVAPFPLSAYIAGHPIYNEQFGGGLPSRVYHALYNWWLPELATNNPYKRLFDQHMVKTCQDNPGFCSND
jgi:hypothetical protein